MSSREWSLRVQDILRAINSIQQCTTDITQAEFEVNEMAIHAVLYNLIVIGEAAVNIPTQYFSFKAFCFVGVAVGRQGNWGIGEIFNNLSLNPYFPISP